MHPNLSAHVFDLGATLARAQTHYVSSREPTVIVQLAELGPAGVGVAAMPRDYPRCHADVFSIDGTLTITATDSGVTVREYVAGEWLEATAYGADGHICYSLKPGQRRRP